MGNDLLNKFGPCGLLCEKCFAFSDGKIKCHARMLKENLGQFDNYARRFVSLLNEPIFEYYPQFKEFLNRLTLSDCKGCRKQECHLFQDCNVHICYKEKNVNFCYECDEFPCNRTGFDENLHARWLKINNRIKEIGLEQYYEEIKDKARYL